MKRLVIGGPEKYDDTFQDWPDIYLHFRVPNENRKPSFIYDPNDYEVGLDVHTYSRHKVWLWDGRIVEVWRSTERSIQTPIEPRYWYNLLGCTDKWQRLYDKVKMTWTYQYFCFGEWHTYWEPTNEYLYKFAGQSSYSNWLIHMLLINRNEMRCYFVERIDQTAKIGSGDS